MEAEDDLQDLEQFNECDYAKMPQVWPVGDFDNQMVVKMHSGTREVTILPIQ
jgi:hypothetical protein